MKSLKNTILESKTTPEEIKNYIKSWLKMPIKEIEMNDVIYAISEGIEEAVKERRDNEKYNTAKSYNKATDALEYFFKEL